MTISNLALADDGTYSVTASEWTPDGFENPTSSSNATLTVLTPVVITTESSPLKVATLTGGGPYTNGSPVTVTATVTNDCYYFTNWTVGGKAVSTNSTYTFATNMSATLVANFLQFLYDVQTASDPSNGGTTSGGGEKDCDATVTVTAQAATGFRFVNWGEHATGPGAAAAGTIISSNVSYSFPASAGVLLTANFLDVTPPSLTITSPTANQRWSNSQFTITGTAKDNVAVSNVFYSLNETGWSNATTANIFTNWTANVMLTPGSNTLRAYAADTSGNNSSISNVSFLYIPSATLTVQTNGLGGITPVDNGKLFAIGTNYILTATPSNNWLFSNWVASGSETFVSNNAVLEFNMQSNLVLQANFVTNLFLAAQGAYNGLFAPTNDPRQQTNSGSFTFSVTTNGVFSGKLYLGSATNSFSGQFDVGGYAQAVTNSLTITLQLNWADQSVQGMVTGGSFVALLNGDQAVFSSSHEATNYAGQYTLIIPGTNNPANGPFGTSYGSVTVSESGAISFVGSLADGTSVSQSTGVSKDGNWPFYVPLYGGKGSLWAWNLFTNHTIISVPCLSWINATNSSTAAVYRSGFTNQQATVTGSFYTPTNKPLLGVTNAQVTLDGGNLPVSITNQITWASNNTITVPEIPENTNGLKLTITNSTGVISGSFANPADTRQTIKVNGVILQDQTNVQGYFLGTNQSGVFLLGSP